MINRFLKYVEIATKITSVFAFLMTLAYLNYIDQDINWKLTSVFIASAFIFDMTTTAINNYIDTKTNGQQLHFERKTALYIIYFMFAVSALLGMYLVLLTDIAVLFMGGLCFLCGVFYTYGPAAISRLPLGEVMSGFFYGIMIPFILLYINIPEGTFLKLDISIETVSLSLSVIPLLKFLLFSTVPFCTTANIMLANNICDIEKDIKVKRHTLPYYIGVEKSIALFEWVYYLSYIAVILMVVFGILHPLCILHLLTLYAAKKNINTFKEVQDKETTFITAIKNYIIIMASICMLIFISSMI